MKNIFIMTLLFYFLALLQTNFLAHFSVFGYVPNLILISVVLMNLFQRAENYSGFVAAAIGGFFLDVFSSNFIGFWSLILLAAACFIKFILKRYVQIPFVEKI